MPRSVIFIGFSLILATLLQIQAYPSTTKAFFGYFTNWSIYARNFQPTDIPASKLSHLLYAFFQPGADGTVQLTDAWADVQKHYQDDSWNEPGNNLYGNLKQLYLLKQRNRKMKVLMSIGGWTLSSGFPAMAASPNLLNNFVNSVITFIEDYGFDGVDIDWEFPASPAEGQLFLNLMKRLKSALFSYQARKRDSQPYLLTAAMSCSPDKYTVLPLRDLASVVDYFNLMCYDFAGSWSSQTGHNARFLGPAPSGQAAITYFAQRVPTSKIVLGVPAYGRSFAKTSAVVPSPFQGVGGGSWESGVYDYKVLPIGNAKITYDVKAVAVTSYDSSTRELVSYDDANVVKEKLRYVDLYRLGGVMLWELSGDKNPANPNSLVSTISQWAGRMLESSPNHLLYPSSQFNNIKNALKYKA